ncbi:MAG: beta-ketoacyl synthase N-terminal-like domain-containing protein [Pirellulaceae bacterium]
MTGANDIVITGIGCVTPIGIGREAFWRSLQMGTCGVRRIHTLSTASQATFYGATINDFDGKQYVKPRKTLKVMSREGQLAYSSAVLAWKDAGLPTDDDACPSALTPERVGVIYGSEIIPGDHADLEAAVRACSTGDQMNISAWGQEFSKHIFPLWMLRNLPNMPACHIGIAIDARGPNNTIVQEEISSLLALTEAMHVIERQQADLMLVGGVGQRVSPTRMIYRAPGLYDQHALDTRGERCIPFDKRRSGIVSAEGAGTLVIERRSHAAQRGAKIYGVVKSGTSRYGRPTRYYGGSATAMTAVGQAAMVQAGVAAADLAHVSAQGYSEQHLDIAEATAIEAVAPQVPVTAFSSYFGTAGAACGVLELAASVLATQHGIVLPTLGYQQPDSDCPLAVCRESRETTQRHILKLSFTPFGQAAAVVIQCTT